MRLATNGRPGPLVSAIGVGLLVPAPALAIPSPDLAVNFFANAAQLLGLLTVVVGGGAVAGKAARSRSVRGGSSLLNPVLRAVVCTVSVLLLASIAVNALQWAASVDERNRRLQANLVRPSKEAGKSVGDVSLKTLPFSEQQRHPLGIATDELERLMASVARTGEPDINFIDLREPEEWETGQIEGFTRVRYPDFPFLWEELNLKDRRNVLLCYSGNRSSETCEFLTAQGVSCNFIVGGYEKWMAEGRRVKFPRSRPLKKLRAIPDYPNNATLLDTPEAQRAVAEEGAIFVDVRYPGDFELGHLPAAVNIPIRKLASAEMWARLKELPARPIIAPCYDKRGCFYAEVLGLRLHRLGYDFRGRYTVPNEYFAPTSSKAYVEQWSAAHNRTILGIIQAPLERLLLWVDDRVGHLALAIFVLVLLLRLAILPFTVKLERDQVVSRRLAGQIAELKQQIGDDRQRLARALMAIYRKHHLTPARNLLGITVQVPIFLILFVAVESVVQQRSDAFLWMPALSLPDPLYALPLALGGLVFVHLELSAVKHPLSYLALRFLAGALLTAITLQLRAGVNLYLVFSIAAMMLQSQLVKMFLARRRGDATDKGTPRRAAGVVRLAQADCVPGTGNKAARLAQMMAAGLPVPDGFVITDALLSPFRGGLDIPASERSRIDSMWRKLQLNKVAVRSSGLAEDQAEHSYAGVFQSVLNVGRKNFHAALGEVRASFASIPAATDEEDGRQGGGVIVQKMVDAEFAGVLFTEHPAQSGTMLVEMAAGLGDRVVGGTVTPRAYRFGRWSGRALDDHSPPVDLAPLLAFGRRAESLFGCPQDIEWAYRDGRLFLLQSRNITALSRWSHENSARKVFENERHRLLRLASDAAPDGIVFAQNGLSELLPRPTPLSLSCMEALWKSGGSADLACRALGIPYNVREDSPPFVNTVFGALYVNRHEESRRLRRGPGLVASFRLSRAAEALEEDFRRRFLPEFLAHIRLYEAVDLSRLRTDALFDLFVRCRDRFITATYVQAELINIAADFYLKSAERELTRRHLSPASHLAYMPETIVHRAMSLLPDVRAGKKPVAEFLAIFGHRAPVDYELAQPRYNEDSVLVEQLIQNSTSAVGTLHLPGKPPETPKDRTLALSIERVRRFQALKEEAKHHCLREFAIIRRILVELDRRYELDGGIFYLTLEELPLIMDSSSLQEAVSRVAERKAEEEAFRPVGPLPTALTLSQIESLGPDGTVLSSAPVSGKLQGTLVAGEAPVAGRARVIAHEDIEALQEGEILVTRHMHPAWTPLFPRAAGVVTEVGGWLSHAAIVARERNVPTIVGVQGAIDRIETGDLLKLNLDGTVESV